MILTIRIFLPIPFQNSKNKTHEQFTILANFQCSIKFIINMIVKNNNILLIEIKETNRDIPHL